MTVAEDRALRSLIISDAEFAKAGKVFDGRAVGSDGNPIAGTWYLTIQSGADDDSQDRVTGQYVTRTPSTTFQCSGSSPEQAKWVAERLDGVLRPGKRGVSLVVPGSRCDPLRRDYVSPVQIDADVSPPMWFQTVEYSFRSQPSPTP